MAGPSANAENIVKTKKEVRQSRCDFIVFISPRQFDIARLDTWGQHRMYPRIYERRPKRDKAEARKSSPRWNLSVFRGKAINIPSSKIRSALFPSDLKWLAQTLLDLETPKRQPIITG